MWVVADDGDLINLKKSQYLYIYSSRHAEDDRYDVCAKFDHIERRLASFSTRKEAEEYLRELLVSLNDNRR